MADNMSKILYKPFRSNRKDKKFAVYVKKNGKVRKIHFGATGYSDYTQHKDPVRRDNFRARHGCDPVSKLDKATPRYWACQYLWPKGRAR